MLVVALNIYVAKCKPRELLAGYQAGAFDEECGCHAESALPVPAPSALFCGAPSCDEVAHPGCQAFAARRDWQQNSSLWYR